MTDEMREQIKKEIKRGLIGAMDTLTYKELCELEFFVGNRFPSHPPIKAKKKKSNPEDNFIVGYNAQE